MEMKLSVIRILCAGTLAVLTACNSEIKVEQKQTLSEMKGDELLSRGKYLTTIGGCHDCHSPKVMTPHGPEPDTTRLLSGHPESEAIPAIPGKSEWILFSPGVTAFVGPWGISYAANLTPDDTGIGNWTFEQFQTALREGKYKGLKDSRPLMPPMPWQMYQHFTDQDLKAVYTYLKSIKPVDNLVPAYTPPKQ